MMYVNTVVAKIIHIFIFGDKAAVLSLSLLFSRVLKHYSLFKILSDMYE